MFASMSAPCSVARRRLMIDAYPILLTSWIAAGVMAPAHATVDSTLAKFRMPGTSCLTTCALAAVAIRPTTVNSASVGFSGRMPAPPFERCSSPLRVSPRAPCERQTGATAKDGRISWPADVTAQLSSDHSQVVAKGLLTAELLSSGVVVGAPGERRLRVAEMRWRRGATGIG